MTETRTRPPADEYSIDEEQVARFWRDGFIVLRGLLTRAETERVRESVLVEAERQFARQGGKASFGGAFQQAQNLRLRAPVFADFALSARLGALAARLLRVPGVRIYHDQALFKAPGGPASFWHQDQYFWPLATDRSLGLWMPLVEVTPDMGGMRYAAGSHRLGSQGQYSIDEASERHFSQVIAEHDLDVFGGETYAPGDCTFHFGWTIHGADANHSAKRREAAVVTFYPDGTRVDALTNPAREYDARVFLGGREPGERADSPLNPVTWPR